MTDQTLQVMRELCRQAIDENGVSRFLWMVSTALQDAATDNNKTLFYHRHAAEFFRNRADTIKANDGKYDVLIVANPDGASKPNPNEDLHRT